MLLVLLVIRIHLLGYRRKVVVLMSDSSGIETGCLSWHVICGSRHHLGKCQIILNPQFVLIVKKRSFHRRFLVVSRAYRSFGVKRQWGQPRAASVISSVYAASVVSSHKTILSCNVLLGLETISWRSSEILQCVCYLGIITDVPVPAT